MESKKKIIILIQPSLGLTGKFVAHLPLNLLYAASLCVKKGFDVVVVDCRIGDSWQETLDKTLNEALLVGISVMTGIPIKNGIKISKYVKANSAVPVIWGGPHVTTSPDSLLGVDYIDMFVRGYGSKPLYKIAKALSEGESADSLALISGLSYKRKGKFVHVEEEHTFEYIDYKSIPYDLIRDFRKYKQFNEKGIFPIYSALGCPYKCTFCSSPRQYSKIKKKYEIIDHNEVVEHIKFLVNRYGAKTIYFIDEDSFVNLKHVENIIDTISRELQGIELRFRGARIDEILRMSDEFLSKLVKAGTSAMHIGAESGSNKMLELMGKNITREQIIAANRKLAKVSELTPYYNFIVGLPGETIEDLKETKKLYLQIIMDNPVAVCFHPNKFRPLPNTVLFDLAERMGYRTPVNLEEWGEIENEMDFEMPWHTKKISAYISMLFITTYVIDDKFNKIIRGFSLPCILLRTVASLYKPIAKLRLKYDFTGLMVELSMYRFVQKLLK